MAAAGALPPISPRLPAHPEQPEPEHAAIVSPSAPGGAPADSPRRRSRRRKGDGPRVRRYYFHELTRTVKPSLPLHYDILLDDAKAKDHDTDVLRYRYVDFVCPPATAWRELLAGGDEQDEEDAVDMARLSQFLNEAEPRTRIDAYPMYVLLRDLLRRQLNGTLRLRHGEAERAQAQNEALAEELEAMRRRAEAAERQQEESRRLADELAALKEQAERRSAEAEELLRELTSSKFKLAAARAKDSGPAQPEPEPTAGAVGQKGQASLASQSARMDAFAAGSHDAIVDPSRLSGTIPGAAEKQEEEESGEEEKGEEASEHKWTCADMAHMLREALESPADQRLQQTFGVMGEDECRKLLLQISRAHPALAKVRTKYKFIIVQGKERRVEEKHKPSQMSGLAAGMAIGKQLQRWCPEVSAATVGLGCDCCRLLTV